LSEKMSLKENLNKLLESIDTDIRIYSSNQNGAAYVHRLKEVKAYVEASMKSIENIKLTDEEQVKVFSERMYQIISAISKLEKPLDGAKTSTSNNGQDNSNSDSVVKDPSNKEQDTSNSVVKDPTTIKNDIHTLIKDISNFNQQLNERQGDFAILKNRLEDLQENLGDLEYTFTTKFETDTNWNEKAQHFLKQKQVQQAKTKHQAIQSDIFAL